MKGWQHIVVLLVFAPVVEETIFRAGMHEALLRRRLSPLGVNLAVAALFGLAHAIARGDPAAMLVALPGLLIGGVYERWRRLEWCVALHAGMNLAWLLSRWAMGAF